MKSYGDNMRNFPKFIGFLLGISILIISFISTLYFGKETFHVEDREQVNGYPKDALHVVIIPEEMENEYWRHIQSGAMQFAVSNNIYLEYEGPKQADKDEQLRILDKMIDAEVDGIITQGIEGERFNHLVALAREKGIPVITIDADAPTSSRNSYVGMDNYQAGFMAGKTMIYNTTGELYVGIIAGILDSTNQKERIAGFKAAIEHEPRIQVVSIDESHLTEVGAARATYQMLKNKPNINAIFGASVLDSNGIVEGLEQMYRSNQDIYVITIDTYLHAAPLLRNNSIDGVITQDPEKMGKTALELLLAYKEGKYIEPFQYTKSRVINKEDIPEKQPMEGVLP
jgi:ribose transport system substrate-binding protein